MLKKYRRPLIAIPFVFLFSFTLCGQDNLISVGPVENAMLKEYSLRKMAADRDGKLWFATDKGVVCYDGNDIIVFDEKSGLSANSVGRIYFGPGGDLFVIMAGNREINKLNRKTGRFSQVPLEYRKEDEPKYAFPYVYSEPYITGEDLWIGMYNVGFVHHDFGTGATTYFPTAESGGLTTRNVMAIRPDAGDTNILWLATMEGILRFDKKTQKITRNYRCTSPEDSAAVDNYVFTMDVAGRDTIWFTVPVKGIGCYDIRTGRYTIFPNRDVVPGRAKELTVQFFRRKSNDEYYFASADALPGIFNIRTRRYDFPFKNEQPMPAIQFRHFLNDSSGNFWNLIFYQLYRARNPGNRFQKISLPAETVHRQENMFKTIVWDAKRRRYYAAFDTRNEIFVLDTNLNLLQSIPIEFRNEKGILPEPAVNFIGVDKNGRLWVCGSKLGVLDERAGKIVESRLLKKEMDFPEQNFQNLLFRDRYMYLQPADKRYQAIYRVDVDRLSVDSIRLPEVVLRDTAYISHYGKITDVLEIDASSHYAYFCYGLHVFQMELATRKVRKVFTVPGRQRPVFGQEAFNPFWYKLDDDGNIWVAHGPIIRVFEPRSLRAIKNLAYSKDGYHIQFQNIDGRGIMCALWSGGVRLYDYRNNYRVWNLSLSDGLTTIANYGVRGLADRLFVGAIDYLEHISLASVVNRGTQRKCYLTRIQLFNKVLVTDTIPGYLKTLRLPHDQNFIGFAFSTTEYDQPERIEYRYKLRGVDKRWVHANYLNRTVTYNDLKPGEYVFYAMVKNTNGEWSKDFVKLRVIIVPAWWQTSWFQVLAIALIAAVLFWFVRLRMRAIRKQEQLRAAHEKEMLELEAKALRSQMNPHFIFNSLNSIKSLINKGDNDKAADYLTTFSKLIRTLFQNSDKREISLHEEIETCRLYTQLEKMRFGNKVQFLFEIDPLLDLKEVKIPALILQPFIENAIWHGLVPKEEGGKVIVSVRQSDGAIECTIDDNGIGRDLSRKYHAEYEGNHESRGIGLTQSRLELDKVLSQREDTIEVIDKKDASDHSLGTTVIVRFKDLNQ